MSPPDRPGALVTGNLYDKYGSRNPLYRKLVQGFVESAESLARRATPCRILEVGCGPGDLALRLRQAPALHVPFIATDLGLGEVLKGSQVHSEPGLHFTACAAELLPFSDRSFDLVVACEVLEHLEDPAGALQEISRVCRGHLLASVPWEPVWRLLNVARGTYLSRLGNTPGHLHNFSRRAFRRLLAPSFRIVEEQKPFPWTMVLARVRDD